MLIGTPPIPPHSSGDEKQPERVRLRKDIAVVLGTLFIAYGLYSLFTKKVVNFLGLLICAVLKGMCSAKEFIVLGYPDSVHLLYFKLNVGFYIFLGIYFLLSIEKKKK